MTYRLPTLALPNLRHQLQRSTATRPTSQMTTAATTVTTDVLRGITVSPTAPDVTKETNDSKPAHHKGKVFVNPWPSFRQHSTSSLLFKVMFNGIRNQPKVPVNLLDLIPVQTPNWGADASTEALKATWLGHACYFVELPTPPGAKRGPRIIFDPALSHRCFASEHIGPARITPVPCKLEDIPELDAIVLSHNHYDHTDTKSLQRLVKIHNAHVFAPLGNGPYLESCGIPPSNIHILDWWDSCTMDIQLPSADPGTTSSSIKVTCTPCQHFSGRGIFDRAATLWASWAIEEVIPAGSPRTEPKKVYFAGDTAYRTVFEGEDENAVPVCPAFAEIGERLGPFDLAMIPIGAYGPRWLFSNVHASPSDSVRIFQDIKAKKALAMHWGTWILTTEPIMEPPELLRSACELAGIPEGDFVPCGLGETRVY